MGQDYKTPQNSWFGTPEEQLDAPAPGSDTPTMDNTAAQAKLASQTPANDPSTPLLHALTGGGDDGQAEGGFSWTQPLAEDPGPAVPPFQESWWFGGLDEVGLDPIETEGSARLPEQDGSRPGVPGADPNRDGGLGNDSGHGRVGTWGFPSQGQVALLAGDYVTSTMSVAEAEAAALQLSGASVITIGDGPQASFSVYALEEPKTLWATFTRDEIETAGGGTNVYMAGDVHAMVTLDGYLLANGRDVAFDDATAEHWAGVGAGALGENVLGTFERAMASLMLVMLDKARAGGEEQAGTDPDDILPVVERVHTLNQQIADLDREIQDKLKQRPGDRYPRSELPGVQRLQRECVVLRSERSAEVAQFPLVGAIDDLGAFVAAGDEERRGMLRQGAVSVHLAVTKIERALTSNDLELYSIEPLVMGTLAHLGIAEDEPAYAQITEEMSESKRDEELWGLALTIIQLVAATVGMSSGGLGAAAIVMGGAVGLADAAWMTEAYYFDQNLAMVGAGDAAS